MFGQIGKTGVLVLQNVELGCEKEQDQSNKKICIMENLVKISKLKPNCARLNLVTVCNLNYSNVNQSDIQ